MDTAVPIDSKLSDVGVSIFAVMTRLANEHGAINLSQGFPDFACDPELVAAMDTVRGPIWSPSRPVNSSGTT